MMRRSSLLAATAAALLLTACGRQMTLKPKPGMGPVPTAADAPRPETPDELMTPSSQSRPLRNIDLITRSERRPDDPFSLPPGADNGR